LGQDIIMGKILFHTADRQLKFYNKKQLKLFIESIFISEKKNLSALSYIVCSDEYLLQINKSFLNHDFYTDIITFDLSENEQDIIGEIYISLDRVADNTKQHQTSKQEETLRVLFHGVLHLCGYKDKTKKEVVIIRAKEDFYINLYLA
jgi:probable rRNA maturation factor